MNKEEFLIIAIATLITVGAWVTFDIMHARHQIKNTPNLEELTRPIDPNFNLQVLENE